MARTFADIQRQIEKLQLEAESVKAKEVAGVVKRIKIAIEAYGLTPADLFETAPKKVGRPKKVATTKVKKAANKSAPIIRFKDEATGKTWTGHGKRPNWFLAAIEGGKNPADLAVTA